MTFARIFLILSVIDLARAAPALIREMHQVHVDVVHVAEEGGAQRWEPWAHLLTYPPLPPLHRTSAEAGSKADSAELQHR
jgi:hypothetical protein